jgi:hypothetical protein
MFNEGFKIGGGEHAPLALSAMADDDVAERARLDVAPDDLDRAAKLARCFLQGHQAAGHRGARVRGALARSSWRTLRLGRSVIEPPEVAQVAKPFHRFGGASLQ